MVTSGANQAFTNIVLTLVDAEDKVVLFKPYYFNHLMALQMTGGGKNVMYGPAGAGLKPDLDWLENELKSDIPPKMVVIVNPCNPAGSLLQFCLCMYGKRIDTSWATLPHRFPSHIECIVDNCALHAACNTCRDGRPGQEQACHDLAQDLFSER